MIWFTWRQFRTQTWIAVGGLAVVAVVLGVSGHALADLWTGSGAAACHADCGNAVSLFLSRVAASFNDVVFNIAGMVMYVVPALIGIFWGAPLVARELESGTYRLAFNQSVTRTRWLATKLALLGGATAGTVGALTWSVTAWAHHIDHANGNRISPMLFGARGIVPVGYGLFAFALGVTVGMLIRRTVPAMAVTLAVYATAVASMPLWVRAHLVPASRTTAPLDINDIHGIMLGPDGQMQVVSGAPPAHGWVLSNVTVTPAGHPFTGPANIAACGPDSGMQTCLNWIGTLGLREDATYQPASHFWALQWAETGLFVGAAALLVGFCFWWTRRLT